MRSVTKREQAISTGRIAETKRTGKIMSSRSVVIVPSA